LNGLGVQAKIRGIAEIQYVKFVGRMLERLENTLYKLGYQLFIDFNENSPGSISVPPGELL